ncbi:hypothetical protein NDU88_008186 [Pleurodeles waltl]|uniref:Uncharacterized protein n=1 Tax=Pleurodeles waltl TaxID=8319 RepID=A0AAV7SUZ1_PLEWA|nr:hypothetical protein NDU88_008186 [Pleurodeles waltl]
MNEPSTVDQLKRRTVTGASRRQWEDKRVQLEKRPAKDEVLWIHPRLPITPGAALKPQSPAMSRAIRGFLNYEPRAGSGSKRTQGEGTPREWESEGKARNRMSKIPHTYRQCENYTSALSAMLAFQESQAWNLDKYIPDSETLTKKEKSYTCDKSFCLSSELKHPQQTYKCGK